MNTRLKRRSGGTAPAARPAVPWRERRLNFGGKWDYAPALEDASACALAPRHELFSNGKFQAPRAGRYFEAINPATEAPLSEVAQADAGDVGRAVKAARRAYDKTWSRLPGRERGKYLFRLARLIQEKSRELALLETLDTGRPVREASGVDLPQVAAHFFYYAGWADKLRYAFPGRRPRPVGVAGQIISWNAPLVMAAWKIAPALACGNTVVIKPSPHASLSLLRLAQLFQEAELPPGVVNVLTGPADTGAALAAHPGVDVIAFAGSPETGKCIAAQLAGTGRRLTLQLGGPVTNIIFEDAPVDQAIEGVMAGIQFNLSPAGSRLLVQESIYPEVLRKLTDRLQTLRVGNPLDKNTDLGPVNNRAQLERIRAAVRAHQADGAQVIRAPGRLPPRGYWYPAMVLTGAATTGGDGGVAGPVLLAATFRTPEEAVVRANHSPCGGCAGVWTAKGSKALRLVTGLRAGTVWVNSCNKFDPASPFGGFKESGLERDGGRHGLASYCRLDQD